MQINGHKFSLGTALAVGTMLAGLAASWFVWGQQAGKLEQRVQTVEERQKEDRKEIKESVKDTQADVKDVKKDVEQIRILLEGMRRERVAR